MNRRTCLLASVAASLQLVAPARAAPSDPIRIGAAISLTGQFAREGDVLRNGYDYWKKATDHVGASPRRASAARWTSSTTTTRASPRLPRG